MLVLLTIAALLLLWAFIVWERKRPIRPLSRAAMSRGWSARALLRWPVLAGLSLCCGVLAIKESVQPSQPPFTGKLSPFFRAAFEYFGPAGASYVWWALTVGLVVAAVVSWHKREVLGSSEHAEG